MAGLRWLRSTVQAVAFAGVAVLSLAVFFRVALVSRFGQLWGNNLDGGIEAAILEHWYNVLRGVDAWNRTTYFYPYSDTLGYNDGYFLYGMMHAAFRWAGADVFMASALVDMSVKAVGFAAMFVLLRRAMACRAVFALFGAALFTIAHGSFVHSIHQQLLSVAFAPLLAWLAWEAWRALTLERPRAFVLWGGGAGVLWGAWLLTAFYMAWFALLFGFVLAVVALPIAGWAQVRAALMLCWRRRWQCAAVVAVTGLAIVPFLIVYLPKLAETGGQSWEKTLYFTPYWNDVVNLGPNDMLWGRFYKLLCRSCTRDSFELTTGITPILLWLFAAASMWLCFRRAAKDVRGRPVLLATALAVLVIALLLFRWKAFAPWWIVWKFMPGASGVRVISRLLLFLIAPLIVVVVPYLQNLSTRVPAHLVMLLGLLVLLEQAEPGSPMYTREAELAHLAVPPPPAECKAFYVSATEGSEINAEVFHIYPHNVEAMVVSEQVGLPTINGWSTFAPPDWNFSDPLRPDYEARVQAYAAAHAITGLCRLDLMARRWGGPG
jgi:hypothetical protein